MRQSKWGNSFLRSGNVMIANFKAVVIG